MRPVAWPWLLTMGAASALVFRAFPVAANFWLVALYKRSRSSGFAAAFRLVAFDERGVGGIRRTRRSRQHTHFALAILCLALFLVGLGAQVLGVGLRLVRFTARLVGACLVQH